MNFWWDPAAKERMLWVSKRVNELHRRLYSYQLTFARLPIRFSSLSDVQTRSHTKLASAPSSCPPLQSQCTVLVKLKLTRKAVRREWVSLTATFPIHYTLRSFVYCVR